mmetsp:Transcript_97739/g.169283  ORF Transcript_97739/g.169283 Transcript_97739/m.169283 type:complete len:265 (-) Transcript_97739:142-936(-)
MTHHRWRGGRPLSFRARWSLYITCARQRGSRSPTSSRGRSWLWWCIFSRFLRLFDHNWALGLHGRLFMSTRFTWIVVSRHARFFAYAMLFQAPQLVDRLLDLLHAFLHVIMQRPQDGFCFPGIDDSTMVCIQHEALQLLCDKLALPNLVDLVQQFGFQILLLCNRHRHSLVDRTLGLQNASGDLDIVNLIVCAEILHQFFLACRVCTNEALEDADLLHVLTDLQRLLLVGQPGLQHTPIAPKSQKTYQPQDTKNACHSHNSTIC